MIAHTHVIVEIPPTMYQMPSTHSPQFPYFHHHSSILFLVSAPSLPRQAPVSFKLFFSHVFILDCTLGFIFISHLVIWLRVLQQCLTLQSSMCFATIASQIQTNGEGYSRLAALTVS